MIGTIRKHQQWLWAIIITLTIISFLWWFSPNARWGNMWSKASNVAMINGKPVTIEGQTIPMEDFAKAFRETLLAAFMRTGGREWPANDEKTRQDLERDAVYRVFLGKKLKELNIAVSDKAVAEAARERLQGFPITSFEKEYLQPHGLTIDDFEMYLKKDLAIQQLISAAGVSSKLYSPREGEALYRKQHELNDTQVAIFSASNYLDKVNVTPSELTNFYNSSMSAYRVPERVVVNYVEFPATNFFAEADQQIAKITNYNQRVDEVYGKRGTNYYKGTNGTVLSAEDAKKQIREDSRKELALIEARKKANDLGTALYDMPQNDKADNLEKKAAAMGLVVKTSPPLEKVPKDKEETEFPKEFRERAFKLSGDTPLAFTPIVGENAVYIIALKNKVPSEIQKLEAIKDKVTADFKHSKALDLAHSAATNFVAVATNGLAQKKTFDQICAEAKVTSIKPERFSSATASLTNLPSGITLENLQKLASEMKPGMVSRFGYLETRSSDGKYLPPEGGFVLYLKERLPVDEATVKKDLPEFLARMRIYRQNEAFNQWFRKQYEQSKVVIPPPNSSISAGS